jgi:hypothetical protein
MWALLQPIITKCEQSYSSSLHCSRKPLPRYPVLVSGIVEDLVQLHRGGAKRLAWKPYHSITQWQEAAARSNQLQREAFWTDWLGSTIGNCSALREDLGGTALGCGGRM